MARLTTDKQINAAQLAGELGVDTCTLRHNDADGTVEVDAPDAPEDALRDAVAAHSATFSDPDADWRDAIRNASTLADLKAVLAGDTDVGQAVRRPSGSR